MFNASEIRDILENVRKEYFTDKGLETMEGIYYMNGNDGTDFDWACNRRVCEFYILKPNGDGLAKLLAHDDDSYTVYVYDYAEPYSGKGTVKLSGELSMCVADLARYLMGEFDNHDIYDSVVGSWEFHDEVPVINFAHDEDDDDEW